MLKKFVENNHFIFIDEVATWQEAVKLGCKPLEDDGTVEENYADDIIECIEKHGPYIVIMPNVAMPHSQEGANGVHKTAISFMKLEKPISFEEGDPDKDASLFFTLASCNHNEHLANMSALTEMLLNEELINELLNANTREDLLKLHDKYLAN